MRIAVWEGSLEEKAQCLAREEREVRAHLHSCLQSLPSSTSLLFQVYKSDLPHPCLKPSTAPLP